MDEYTLYKYLEFLIIVTYLFFIYLLVHIWFLWKDIEKTEMFMKTLVQESFFRKNCVYIFLFSSFSVIHEFLEGLEIPNTFVYFEFIELLAIIILVLFAYNWFVTLKPFAKKRKIIGQ